MKTKDEYIDSFAAELKEWSAQIDLLSTKTEQSALTLKHKYAKDLNILRSKHKMAKAKMNELQEASAEAWDVAKESADKIWDDLREGFADAATKFN